MPKLRKKSLVGWTAIKWCEENGYKYKSITDDWFYENAKKIRF